MPLTLRILSFKGQPVAQAGTVTIGNEGGTIGRSDDNTLVLADPDRLVSRHHARISVKNGWYYLTDSSLSGIFIAGQSQTLHNNSQQIFDGAVLKIGEYEIAVGISDDANADDFPFVREPVATGTPSLMENGCFLSADELNANSLLTNQTSMFVSHEELVEKQHSFQPAFESRLHRNSSPLFDSYIPPGISSTAGTLEEIPENLSFEDLFADTAASPSATSAAFNIPTSSTQPSAAPAVTGDTAFSAFLQGAGISTVEIQSEQQPETMRRVGQMFRKLVDGTVALLRSRAEFKSMLRLNMTVIRATANNPLKFSVSTDDVLKQLLENKSSGFLNSSVAIEEGFNDIMNHQLAMQAGIQASLTSLLKSFDPVLIEKEFEQGLVLQKKSKCWDKFSETYQNTVDNAVDDFFGEAFIEAYEAQMQALTAAGKRK